MSKASHIKPLVLLIILDIALSFAYGLVTPEMKAIRATIDSIQFFAMAVTMIVAFRAVLSDF